MKLLEDKNAYFLVMYRRNNALAIAHRLIVKALESIEESTIEEACEGLSEQERRDLKVELESTLVAHRSSIDYHRSMASCYAPEEAKKKGA